MPYDGHDPSMALPNRTLTPQQRLDSMLAFQRFANAGRESMRAAKAANVGGGRRQRASKR